MKIRLLKNLVPFCNNLHKFPFPLLFLPFPKIQTKVTESIFGYFDVIAWPLASSEGESLCTLS